MGIFGNFYKDQRLGKSLFLRLKLSPASYQTTDTVASYPNWILFEPILRSVGVNRQMFLKILKSGPCRQH
jgi:hypothetical protein